SPPRVGDHETLCGPAGRDHLVRAPAARSSGTLRRRRARPRPVHPSPGGTMSRLLYAILPLLGGAMIAAQAPVNARLRLVLASPIGSAFVSFLVGTALLALAVAVVGDAGSLGALGGGPWWAYLGGALGAFFVVATLVAAPRGGVTTTFVS